MNLKGKGSLVPSTRGWKVLAALGLAGILITTLYPAPGAVSKSVATPLWCIVCGSDGGADVLLNLFLFVPFAVGLRLTGQSWRRVVVVSGLLSLAIETLQLTVIPGRDASLSDVLTNTSGSMAAAAAAPLLPLMLFPPLAVSRRLLWAWAALWLGVIAGSSWLMAPWVPDSAVWSNWAPGPYWGEPFGGKVITATADGLALPNGKLDVPAGQVFTQRLGRKKFHLAVLVTSGRPTDYSNWVYVIEATPMIVPLLSQEGRNFLFSIPVRGLRFNLRAPTMELIDGFPKQAGVPVQLGVGGDQRKFWIGATYGGIQRLMELQLSPAQGWSLIAVFGLALGPYGQLVTGLYLAAWLLPLGYWAARSAMPAGAAAAIAGTLVVGLGLIPACAGYPPVHWSEWAGALAGVTAGWALYRPAAYLETRCASPSISEFSSS